LPGPLIGRSANDARDQYIRAVLAAISCFAENQYLLRLGFDDRIGGYGLTVRNGDAVLLEDEDGAPCLGLAVAIYYRPIQAATHAWTVRTLGYSYQFESPEEPPRELLRFDWHPHIPGISYPHVHPAKEDAGGVAVVTERAHIPTGGFITLWDVFTHSVRDFRVHPIRADWRAILAVTHAVQEASLAWIDPRG
jgi:hypothetical protein